ncbi:MAG: signal peptidase I [Lachnospiraceae bacterium]|nr:signal peptidase I [Candidatus Colinaster equi]
MSRHSKGLNFNRRRVKVSSENILEVFRYVFGIVAAIGLAAFLIYNLGMKTSVIGSSMETSLYNGQTIFISRLSYLFKKPKAGDVVVFLPNGNHNTHYYVKRVVAVPGDKVVIRGGELYVNDEPEMGEYDKIADAGIADTPLTLGSDEYFVLGDNRNNGEDSRSGNIGPVKKNLIEGRAWFKLSKNESAFGFIMK